jgi:O-antigen/teichoic acid export membrane protein
MNKLVKVKLLMNISEDKNISEDELTDGGDRDTDPYTPIRLQRLRLPSLRIDQLVTHGDLKAISKELLQSASNIEYSRVEQSRSDIMDADTWILPIIRTTKVTNMIRDQQRDQVSDAEDQVSVLRKLIRSSGIYALSSVASPLISLVLAPFLTHNLSPTDYGILAITNIAIGLTAGITQLGLASAFFRAYSYDFTSQHDRRDVVATTTALLFLTSTAIVIMIAMMASTIASLLFGRPYFSNYVILAGCVVLLQNLTVPGMAWLRAEKRPLIYSLLSISNLLVTLFANIILVGELQMGVPGSIIANGSGYACIVICTLPFIVLRAGIKIRADIAWDLLSFGLPLVLNFVSYWVLQLSDRYLLGLFTSFAETARYTATYTLGSAMSVVIMGPFALAWPTAVFAIARRVDAVRVFRLVFHWFSLFLLFSAFCLSLIGIWLLNWLFPVTYRSAAFVIPVVAESIALYGVYYIFKSGLDIKRKTWLISVYTTIAALVNVVLNLCLIPHFGAIGAAASTLVAYAILATVAYIVNRRIYPVPFEIDMFIVALLTGIALYVGSDFLAQAQSIFIAWGIRICALGLYGGCLIVLGLLLSRRSFDR